MIIPTALFGICGRTVSEPHTDTRCKAKRRILTSGRYHGATSDAAHQPCQGFTCIRDSICPGGSDGPCPMRAAGSSALVITSVSSRLASSTCCLDPVIVMTLCSMRSIHSCYALIACEYNSHRVGLPGLTSASLSICAYKNKCIALCRSATQSRVSALAHLDMSTRSFLQSANHLTPLANDQPHVPVWNRQSVFRLSCWQCYSTPDARWPSLGLLGIPHGSLWQAISQ
jgi:hypothetical protein